jgi:ABC-type polysaccharide/polyol phosphate export permease
LMMLAYWVAPTTALLWLPVVLLITAILSAAFAYPAALFGLWYPELQSFVGALVRILFFVAPGLVALDQITGTTRELLRLNPLTGLFESFRDALIYGHSPAAWELLSPLAAAALLLAISLPLYRREQAYVAKLLG